MDPEHKVSDEGVESPRPTTPTTESQDAVEQNKSRPSTPPESAEGKEHRLSRKREREVSLEPSTPQATSSDVEPSSESREKDRDRRKPAKKYRTSGQLDSTQEEGDDVGLADASSGESASNTPPGSLPRGVRTPPKRRRSSQHGHTGTPRRGHSQHGQEGDAMISDVGAVSSSPPMETKVRMISRGVEDLTWKGGQTSQANEGAGDIILAEQDVQQQQTPPRSDDGKEDHESMDHEPTPAASQAEDKVVEESVTIPVPPGLNPPLAEDVPIGEDEHGGQADPAEVPAEAQPEATESPVAEDQKDVPTESQEVQVIEQTSESTSTSTSPTFPTPPLSASTVSTVESTTRKGSPPPNNLPRKRSQAFADTSSAESQSAGVKRKLGDRAVSDAQVPELEELDRRAKRRTPSPPVEQSKKEEEQQNEVKSTKEEEVAQEESAAPKLGGFAAYASTNSPFAAVKGRNVFTSSSSSIPSSSTKSPWATPPAPSPPSYASNPFATSSNSSSSTPALASPAPSSPGQKRSGFEAFANISPFGIPAKRSKSPSPAITSASTSSSHFGGHSHSHPLGALRPKSPLRSHSPARSALASTAFSAYANRNAFGSVFGSASAATSSSSVLGGDSSANASGDESENKASALAPKSFGERLRAEKDLVERDDDEEGGMNGFEATNKVDVTEQEVVTGEENEDTVYQVRGKLFTMSSQNTWKEKGTGQLKLNVRREDGEGARLLMRKEAVYTVLLNAPLFKGMSVLLAQDPRYLRFGVLENGVTRHYNFRVPSAKIAEELLEEINSHIPGDD